jgi:uncharacterized protein (DUF362 family)/Pyruvate/2-oxoacid:ferredoxin oxidoreductase delta subunit
MDKVLMNSSIDGKYKEDDSIKTTVSIVKVSDYDLAKVYKAVINSINLIGNPDEIIKPHSKVFVKINHLSPPTPAEKGIVTHPVFVEAVLKMLKELDTDITVGDDVSSNTVNSFNISGFQQMCDRSGVKLVNLREGGFTEVDCKGYRLDRIYLSRIALQADVIVNLPKLKTHSLTILTGGVKNMYGMIPSGYRVKFHGEYAKSNDFNQVLVDIYSAIRPTLTIMDAIIAMEGEGPASGKLRRPGVILSSQDAVALDTVAARIIGLNPGSILTTQFCNDRGLGTGTLARIKITGEQIEDVALSDFRSPIAITNMFINTLPAFLPQFFIHRVAVRPYIRKENCTACAECEKICPVGAITIVNNKAAIRKEICISCMCCHEVCRFNAISPKYSLLGILAHIGSIIVNALRKR